MQTGSGSSQIPVVRLLPEGEGVAFDARREAKLEQSPLQLREPRKRVQPGEAGNRYGLHRTSVDEHLHSPLAREHEEHVVCLETEPQAGVVSGAGVLGSERSAARIRKLVLDQRPTRETVGSFPVEDHWATSVAIETGVAEV